MGRGEAYRVACYHRDNSRTPGTRAYWEQVIDRMMPKS